VEGINEWHNGFTLEEVTRGKAWLPAWWNKHKDKYHRMAAAARDYLAIPALEVACERDLIGLRRYSLEADTMRRLTLLRDWYRYL
jgi:hypothetical protein